MAIAIVLSMLWGLGHELSAPAHKDLQPARDVPPPVPRGRASQRLWPKLDAVEFRGLIP